MNKLFFAAAALVVAMGVAGAAQAQMASDVLKGAK